eukprot:gnl/TRDRNA2_/TRDRNA2_144977_c0_seq1.p1 gnl/TRDRNA2_/TRDRNA2_144977_c0~~gnl/TRDRNA2_/TRDRNA2_144977_c0_seq1.p1  ORF type:complete len:212 (-),score=13.89 gnl/TRDRNA2_/TRDRNA2_144977_c0_seq1:121-756(-)
MHFGRRFGVELSLLVAAHLSVVCDNELRHFRTSELNLGRHHGLRHKDPSTWYSWQPFLCILVVALVLSSVFWLQHIYQLFVTTNYVTFVLQSLILAAIMAFVIKTRPIFRFIFAMMDAGPDKKMTARLFAPCQRGPRGEELLSAVVSKALDASKELGFVRWICNVDAECPGRVAFPAKGNFVTKFMHKLLDGSQTLLPRLSPKCIHDPRDT